MAWHSLLKSPLNLHLMRRRLILRLLVNAAGFAAADLEFVAAVAAIASGLAAVVIAAVRPLRGA